MKNNAIVYYDSDDDLNYTPAAIGDLIASYVVNAVEGYTPDTGEAVLLNDFSSNNNDLTGNLGSSPIINAASFNGLTTLSFNGRNLQKLSLSYPHPYSVYLIAKQNNYSQTQNFVLFGNDFTNGVTQIDKEGLPATVIVSSSNYRGHPNMYKSRFAILTFTNNDIINEAGYALDDHPFQYSPSGGAGTISKIKLQGNMDFIEMHIFSKVLTRDQHIGLINNRLSSVPIALSDVHVWFGDSISQGYSSIKSWAVLNAVTESIDYINYAISGSSVTDISNPDSLMFIYDAKGRIPHRAYLSFMYGWNEATNNETNWKTKLTEVLNYFIAKGHDKTKMFLLSAPNVQDRTAQVGIIRDWLQDVATDLDLPFIDVYQYTIDDVTYAPVSGTHPDQVQQQKIADYVNPLMFL
ncbi:MAG: SGNH/GDSL hydrolase family protein [Sphingobacteriaceae bacterium]|nr:SGNH/GDSL hydrolase family protein [Sphingobacteriaceae bacterium]